MGSFNGIFVALNFIVFMKNGITFFFLIALLACGSANDNHSHDEHNASIPKTLSDSLYKSVMDGHDTSMDKMGEIVRLKKAITAQKDSLSKLKTKAPEPIAKLDTVYNSLVYAEELMNRWMDEFNPDNAGTTEEQKVGYYKKELEKIDTVNVRINNSIEAAKKITAVTP